MTDDLKQINTRLDKIEGDLETILHKMDALMRSIEPLVSEKKEEAIEKAKAALDEEETNDIYPRLIKDAAEEYGLSTRALSVLTRRKMHRMADFCYVDLQRIANLRNAGRMTIPEIAAFADHYGFKLPEHRDLEFNIKMFDEVMTVYDLGDLPRGSVLRVESIKRPGAENPFPLYECSYEKDGKQKWVTFTPSEVRKVKLYPPLTESSP